MGSRLSVDEIQYSHEVCESSWICSFSDRVLLSMGDPFRKKYWSLVSERKAVHLQLGIYRYENMGCADSFVWSDIGLGKLLFFKCRISVRLGGPSYGTVEVISARIWIQ
jgi:hypothetical protein